MRGEGEDFTMNLGFRGLSVLLLSLSLPVWAQEVPTIPASLALARATKKVTPDPPAVARQLHLKGEQEVAVVIGINGDVEEASVVRGNAVFTQASLAAIKQWKFGPYVVDGKPLKVKTSIVFNYN
jgi:protein TonB